MVTAVICIAMNNLLISNIYLTAFHNGFASQNYSLTENTYLLIRFNKTKFHPRNTNTDGNGVNKKTQKGMSNNQRMITLKRVSVRVNETLLF